MKHVVYPSINVSQRNDMSRSRAHSTHIGFLVMTVHDIAFKIVADVGRKDRLYTNIQWQGSFQWHYIFALYSVQIWWHNPAFEPRKCAWTWSDTTFCHSKGRCEDYIRLISRVIACFIGPSIYSILLMYIFTAVSVTIGGILLEQKGSILFHQHFTKQGKTTSIYILKGIRNSHFFNRQGPVSACQTKCAHGVLIRLALLSRHLYQLDIRDSSHGSLPSDTVRMFKHCLSFVAQDWNVSLKRFIYTLLFSSIY